MEPKIHAGEDNAVTVTRPVWYQHLCRRKQREAKEHLTLHPERAKNWTQPGSILWKHSFAQPNSRGIQRSMVSFKGDGAVKHLWNFQTKPRITSRREDHNKEKLVGVELKLSSIETRRKGKGKEEVQIKVKSRNRQELRKQEALFFNTTQKQQTEGVLES